MFVYFLRHGDAIQSPAMHDSERPLSPLGIRQASAAGAFLKALNVYPDLIYSSPLLRAQQTAEEVRICLGVDKVHATEFLIPGTRKEQLFDQLNQSKSKSLLLVGHEPHLGESISLLVTGHEGLFVEVRKCSLASVLVSESVRKGHALLQWLLTVEQMQLLVSKRDPH